MLQTSNLVVLLIFPALSISRIHTVPGIRVGRSRDLLDLFNFCFGRCLSLHILFTSSPHYVLNNSIPRHTLVPIPCKEVHDWNRWQFIVRFSFVMSWLYKRNTTVARASRIWCKQWDEEFFEVAHGPIPVCRPSNFRVCIISDLLKAKQPRTATATSANNKTNYARQKAHVNMWNKADIRAVLLSNETSTAPSPRCLQNVADILKTNVLRFVQEETLESKSFQWK